MRNISMPNAILCIGSFFVEMDKYLINAVVNNRALCGMNGETCVTYAILLMYKFKVNSECNFSFLSL